MIHTSLRQQPASGEEGFTLVEMMVALLVLMIVSGTVLKGVMDMGEQNFALKNRTDMHASVRNVTELLTQEVGQAGKVALPAPVTLGAATAVGATSATVSSNAGMFVGEQLQVDTGATAETATITGIAGNTLTTTVLNLAHAAGVPVTALGGFAAGVVPDKNADGSAYTNGSTDWRLKIFGDIQGDGTMSYIEYWCDVANRRLYRNAVLLVPGATKPAFTADFVLIDNLRANPGNVGCFTYQRQSVDNVVFITDVAITLTVETQNRDSHTQAAQVETKTLLNVSPRNVFTAWQLAGLGYSNRVQPMPASVTALLPPTN